MITNFESGSARTNGSEGEKLCQRILEANGITARDVTNNSNYWYKDIDFICYKDNQFMYYAEVKWDLGLATYGNIWLRITNPTKKGWFDFTEADFLFYGDAVNKVFYVFSVSQLREWVNQDRTRFKLKEVVDNSKPNAISSGLLVPLEALIEAGLVLKVLKEEEYNE